MFKGIRNNEGRPKGSANRNTTDIRNNFKLLIENNLDKLQSDLNQLEPRDRLKMMIDLSKFILPTLKAVELTTDFEQNNFKPITIIIDDRNND